MIVDCDTEDSGCNGGLMELTFEWLKDYGGIESMADYPYKGKKQTSNLINQNSTLILKLQYGKN